MSCPWSHPPSTSLASVMHSHGFSYPSYADDTQLIASSLRSGSKVAGTTSACLADVPVDVDTLKLRLDNTELSVCPGEVSPVVNLSVNTENTVVSASRTPGILRGTLCDRLSLATHVAATALSFRFRLNIRRRSPVFRSPAGLHLDQAGLQPYLHHTLLCTLCLLGAAGIRSSHWDLPAVLQTVQWSPQMRGPSLSLNNILVVFCPGSTMVKRAPNGHQESRHPTYPCYRPETYLTTSWLFNWSTIE